MAKPPTRQALAQALLEGLEGSIAYPLSVILNIKLELHATASHEACVECNETLT